MKRFLSLTLAAVACVSVAALSTGCSGNTSYTASEVYNMTKNSVGEIITYDASGDEYALGTGFVYKSDGQILTNYHVIEDAYTAKFTLNNVEYTVEHVLAYDADIDLAVLSIDATNLPAISVSTTPPSVGETAYAFGSSRGLSATFSTGSVTYADRELDGVHYVQHDAATSSGNSGGPLINSRGQLIGIHTMTVRDSQNLNFAISTSELNNLHFGTPITLTQLQTGGAVGGGGSSSAFTTLKSYVMSNGTYDSDSHEYWLDLGTVTLEGNPYNFDVYYNTDENLIGSTVLVDNNFFTYVEIDSALSGYYEWNFFVSSTQLYMIGNVTASTLTSATVLSYTSTNISGSDKITAAKQLASLYLKVMLLYVDTEMSPLGIGIEDFGFTSLSSDDDDTSGGSGGSSSPSTTYTVSVASESTTKGTVSGGGSYASGASATVTASAKSGYTFAGWYNGSTKVSSSASYTFTVNGNVSLTAKFTENTFTKIKNYVVSYGTYSSANGLYLKVFNSYNWNSSYNYYTSCCYFLSDGEIWLGITLDSKTSTDTTNFYLIIDTVDGSYNWIWTSGDLTMRGTVYASSFTTSTTLSASSYNFSGSDLRSTARSIASQMIRRLLNDMEIDYSLAGVSASDLGFTYFS